METSTVELLNRVDGFTEMAEYMQDEQFTNMLTIVARIISNDKSIPPNKINDVIVSLQSYSTKFALMAAWYTNVKKEDRAKKNVYYTAREAVDKLVDALKYLSRGPYRG